MPHPQCLSASPPAPLQRERGVVSRGNEGSSLKDNYQQRHTHNCFTSQLGTSCSFDSPGVASESEGYPGSFAISENNAVGVVPFIYWYFIEAFHAENVQHLRR